MGDARRLYTESLKLDKMLNNQDGIALTLGQMGRLAEDEGDMQEAVRLFREALDIFEQLGSPYLNLAREDFTRVEDHTNISD